MRFYKMVSIAAFTCALQACAFKESEEETGKKALGDSPQSQTANYGDSVFEPQMKIGWKKRTPRTDSTPEKLEWQSYPRALVRNGTPFTESYGAAVPLTLPTPTPDSILVRLRGNSSLIQRGPLGIRVVSLATATRKEPPSLLLTGTLDMEILDQGRVELSFNLMGISALLSTSKEDQLDIKLEVYDRGNSLVASFIFSVCTLPSKITYWQTNYTSYDFIFEDEHLKARRKITTATKVLTLTDVIQVKPNDVGSEPMPLEIQYNPEREITLKAHYSGWFGNPHRDIIFAKKAYILPMTSLLDEQIPMLLALKEPLRIHLNSHYPLYFGVYVEGHQARRAVRYVDDILQKYKVECRRSSFKETLDTYVKAWGCDSPEKMETFECETPKYCTACATDSTQCQSCYERDDILVLQWPPHYCDDWNPDKNLRNIDPIGQLRTVRLVYPEISQFFSIRHAFASPEEDPATRDVKMSDDESGVLGW